MEFLRRITIVGVGLLGGSIGLGLKAANVPGAIIGVGRRRETLERARELGCIDELSDDLESAAAQSQLVILATPLGVFAECLEKLAKVQHPEMVITDVGSAKGEVCARAAGTLTMPDRFVGSHPMAGSERHGPEHARADLFRGRPCVVTPTPETSREAIDIVETLWEILGMHVTSMSPAEHDRKVAHISHLPHAAAALLVNLAANAGGLDIASTGFIDTTRVASGDPRVWLDIFHHNRQAVAEGVDRLIEELAVFRSLLDPAREAELTALLETAKSTRDRLVGTMGKGQNDEATKRRSDEGGIPN